MNNKTTIMIMFVLFTAICLCSAVSAENLTTTETGSVNGGFYHHTVQPTEYGEQIAGDSDEIATFDITESEEQTTNKITDVEYARLYADVYVAGAANNHTTLVNITLDGDNDGKYETTLENNRVLNQVSTTDGTIYPINENISKVYSDYVLTYDVTDFIKDSTIKANVHAVADLRTGNSQCKIKCIGLVVAYNDDSSDKTINYWVNTGRTYLKTDVASTTFAKADITSFSDATLTQVHTSSAEPTTTFNNNTLAESGSTVYFRENKWNVTELYDSTSDAVLTNKAGVGTYSSYASFIASLAVKSDVKLDISSASITSNSANALALEDNIMTVELNNENTVGEATVTLVIDGKEIANNTVDVTNLKTISTSFTFTPTTNGTKNFKILLNNKEAYNGTFTVYYNGYMGKSFTDNENMTTKRQYQGKYTVNIFSNSKYHGASWKEFTESYDATEYAITSQDKIVDVLYYQGYNWDKNLSLRITINNQSAKQIAQYSDTKGFAGYNYPSGLLVYNMTKSFKANAINNITITPLENNSQALYGGYMVVIYENATTNNLILINEGADLLNPTSSGYGANTSTTFTNSRYTIKDVEAEQSTLNVITASADVIGGSKILFNNKEYGSLADNYNLKTQVSITESSVDNLKTENTVKLLAENDNVFVMGTILTLSYSNPYENATVKVTTDKSLAKQDSDVKITVKVSDKKGNPINDGNVTVTVDGKIVKDSKGNSLFAVKNGVATVTYHVAKGAAGVYVNHTTKIYEINATYIMTDTTPQSGYANFSVERSEVIFKITNMTVDYKTSKVHIIGTAVDYKGNLLTGNSKMCIKLNDYTTKDTNGKSQIFTIKNGKINITTNFNNTQNIKTITLVTGERTGYNEARTKYTSNDITTVKSNVRFKITDMTVDYKTNQVHVTGTIVDYEDNIISGNSKMCIKLNDHTTKDTNGKSQIFTIKNGKINITTNFNNTQNIKTITLVTGETIGYNEARTKYTSDNITVEKAPISISITKAVLNKTSGKITVSVNVKNNTKQSFHRTAKVAFKFNGKTYKSPANIEFYDVLGSKTITIAINSTNINNVTAIIGETPYFLEARTTYNKITTV